MSEKKIENVGIGFVTGRKDFKRVLNSYIMQYKKKQLSSEFETRLHLFVVYDLQYTKTKVENYIITNKNLILEFESISYLSSADALNDISKNNKIFSRQKLSLLFGLGYAKMRNIVVYKAIEKKMDYLIFFDDDEYPFACTNKENNLNWIAQDPIYFHLKALSNCDISNGQHCGYISPIPQINYDIKITQDDFKTLIQTVSNDIINWSTLKPVIENGGITFADTKVLSELKKNIVSEKNGMKFITGGNLGINLKCLEKVYPFYNPPNARGEDTFLSTCLTHADVVRIPCYTFHDGFLKYPNIVDEVFPNSLQPATSFSINNINRFISALKGWIRYKPLLLYITLTSKNYNIEIKNIEKKLSLVLPKFASAFKNNEFLQILDNFKNYEQKVKVHFKEYNDTKNMWIKLLEQF